MTSSVDGLISGLSTSAMISQLMQIEAAPQNRLKAKVTTEQSVIGAYQSINTKMAALETAADGVRDLPVWQSAKATSSDSSLVASAATGAAAGSLTFDVTGLARNQISTVTYPGATPAMAVTTSDTVSITIGAGAPVAIDVSADKSANGVAAAINAKGIGVKAAVVTNSSGDAVLQLTSTKTGTANGFTVAGIDAAPVQTAVAARNAEITVGAGPGGYTVSSDTNTFANLMPGVTLTATKIQSGINVTVTSDADAIASKMQAMVDAANAGLAELGKQGNIAVGAKTQAPLAGDYQVRQLSQKTLSTVASGSATYGTFKALGVQLTRDGKLTFDKAAFLAAYAADPAKAQTGATELATAVKTVADSGQKNITDTITNHNNAIKSLNDQIDNWDVRLTTRQASLQRQYANLEVALGKLKDQSSWLAGQIAGLPSGGSS